jgi:glycosyltransferase involved in cell wall biosynthesis
VRGKIVRIPYPIDIAGFDRPPEFDRRAERVRLGYEDGDVVFCFVGLGDFARKGLAVAIDALALLGEQRRGRILVVGGTAGEIAVYRKLADAGGVGERVRFVGFQSDIRPYLWLSDVFLFPTIYETFSKASYEAAAAGLPVIATRVHGIEDLIEDGVNGWFAERTDSSVAAAMRAAVEAHERLPELGRRARESTLAFDRRFYVEKWDRLLARTLAGSSDTARQDDGLVMTSERPGDEPVLP